MAEQNPIKPGRIDSEYISRCLDTCDDFAFEMQVLHILNSADLNSVQRQVEHGGTYIDPVSGTPRQFDIRVHLSRGPYPDNRRRFLRLAVECKRLQPQAPIVISRSVRTKNEAFHCSIRSYFRASGGNRFGVSRYFRERSFYAEGAFVGRSIAQIDTKRTTPRGDEEIYKKWSQALASADDLIWLGTKDASGPAIQVAHSTTLPCLVIPDGTLWTVDYDCKGNREIPEAADCCEFYVGKPCVNQTDATSFTISHLTIFTMSGLKEFLLRKVADGEFWHEHFSND